MKTHIVILYRKLIINKQRETVLVLKNQYLHLNGKSVINDLKKIIKDDLKMNISSDSYNINIY